MGLKEKRRIHHLRNEVLPDVNRQIGDLCGMEPKWDVDWDSFAQSLDALDCVENQGFYRVRDVIRNICYDDIGKEGVREGLKKIVMKNFADEKDKSVKFEDGILTLHGAWGASWGYPNESDIQNILEDGL